MHKREKRYIVYDIDENGLLKHPKRWGKSVFNIYGYKSEEEALKEIDKADYRGDIIIVCSYSWFPE
ncbi:MAG: hypothetical protein WA061_02005 [Microgenomates group bacterium]